MKPALQRAAADGGFEAGDDVESRLASLSGEGSPLPDETRADMEARFGADFSGVRVHSDGPATELTHTLQAKAFTHGRDVYFGAGQYDPGSGEGKRLLAHELTHVVQQTGGQVQRQPESQTGHTTPSKALTDLTCPQAIQRAGKEWEDLSVKERTELWEKFTTAGPQGQAKPPREMVEEESFPLGPISSEVLARGERARQARGKGRVGQTKSPEESFPLGPIGPEILARGERARQARGKGPSLTAGGRTDVHEQLLAWEPEEEKEETVSVGGETTLPQEESDSGLLSDVLDSVAALAERVTKLEEEQ